MKISRENWAIFIRRSLTGLAVTSLGFAALMGVLVVAAWLQLKLNDPLANPALTTLYGRLRNDPEDENLKEDIRALDLLARRAYFSNRGQITAGGLLILAGTASGTLALAAREILNKKLPASPRGRPTPRPQPGRLLARRIMFGTGGALLAGALVVAFVVLPLEAGWGPPSADAPPVDTAQTDAASAGVRAEANESLSPWPGFRGPGGSAAAAAGDWPQAWDGKGGAGVLWKAPLPLRGSNSPVVAGGKVFLSGADRKGAEIRGYDAGDGRVLFTTAIAFGPAAAGLKLDEQNVGFAASTLAADGEHLVAVFATGEVVCLDHAGVVLWRQELGVPELNYGYSSSPLIRNGTLYIQFDHNKGARFIALDPASGELRWEKKRDVYSSWASPIAAVVRGRPALVLSSNPFTMAYDAESGEELWSVELLTGEIGASPAYAGGLVFVGNDPGLMAGLKADDGSTVWEYYDDLPSVASPVATAGLLIMSSSAGTITCLDAATGEMLWKHEFTDGFYASPVAAGGRVYLTDREGVTHIVRADRKYVHVGDASLGEPVDATPALADGLIYIRGREHLYCVGSR